MTLSSYAATTLYEKTEIKYQASMTKLDNSQQDNSEKPKDLIENSLTPVVYTSEANLNNPEKLQKMILQQLIGSFQGNSAQSSLYPNGNMTYDSQRNSNPYEQATQNLPSGLLYSARSEYYEQTTIDFKGEAIIKTPNAQYKIEIEFSYTREFYEKNETQIAIANEQMKKPFEINLDEDDDSLKNLKSMHFIISSLIKQEDENRKDIFEQIKEILAQRREDRLEALDKKDDFKGIDNFQIWQENHNQEMNLVAVQKDGVGLFLANASSESSYMNLNVGQNGYSFEAGYSKTEVSYGEVTKSKEV